MKRLINYPVFFCLITMFTSMALTNDFDTQVQELLKKEENIAITENQKESKPLVVVLKQ